MPRQHVPTFAELRTQHGDNPPRESLARALRAHEDAAYRLHEDAGNGTLSASDQRAFDAHTAEARAIRTYMQDQVLDIASRGRGEPVQDPDPHRSATPRATTQVRSEALRMLDREQVSSTVGDRLTELIRADSEDCDGEVIAQRLQLTCGRAYRSAWRQLLTQQHPMLNAEEVEAVRAVQHFERRTMNIGSDSAGGFAVPVIIDPTIVLTAQGSGNPFLNMARMETITTDAWRGLTSTGVTWRWGAELSTTTDGSPVLAQPVIPAQKADAYIPFSIEAQSDVVNFEGEMQRLLTSGYVEHTVSAYTVGSGAGNNQPVGIVTALDANTNVEVATTTSGEVGGAELRSLWAALPARTRASDRTMFMSSVSVREHVRRLAADPAGVGEGDPSFSLDGGLMFDRPYRVNEFMDSLPTVTTSAANLLVVGAFDGFVIAQRAGMRVELVQHVVDVTNNRPIGARALYAWARAGSDSIDDGKFLVLQNNTGS